MKFGAIHDPDNEAVKSATAFDCIRVGGAAQSPDWFAAWNCPADGEILLNDRLSCCVAVADLRLVQLWLALRGVQWAVPEELVLLRYEATGHYLGTPASDNGTITQEDAFAWQAAPIMAANEAFRIAWAIVQPSDVLAALRRGPLAVTLGLTSNDADDLSEWQRPAQGSVTEYHRVIAGAERGGLLTVRTYGMDIAVHPSRVVAADLLIHVNGPASLRLAGVDYAALG